MSIVVGKKWDKGAHYIAQAKTVALSSHRDYQGEDGSTIIAQG